MEVIELKTPAILFPAVSLLMLAYTNRFLALARIVRDLAQQWQTCPEQPLSRQIRGLVLRLQLIKWMQAFGILSLIGCLISIMFLFFGLDRAGSLSFIFSIGLLFLSLCVCLGEVLLAGNALKVLLEGYQNTAKH
jgi:hypothetical protein